MTDDSGRTVPEVTSIDIDNATSSFPPYHGEIFPNHSELLVDYPLDEESHGLGVDSKKYDSWLLEASPETKTFVKDRSLNYP